MRPSSTSPCPGEGQKWEWNLEGTAKPGCHQSQFIITEAGNSLVDRGTSLQASVWAHPPSSLARRAVAEWDSESLWGLEAWTKP